MVANTIAGIQYKFIVYQRDVPFRIIEWLILAENYVKMSGNMPNYPAAVQIAYVFAITLGWVNTCNVTTYRNTIS
jgi:hypothetical protein